MSHGAEENIFSTQLARIVDVISEGEIEGLVTGDARSIALDETLLGDPVLLGGEAVLRFEKVTFETRNGTATQAIMTGFDTAESTLGVNVNLESNVYATRQITTPGLHALRFNIRTARLFNANNSKGRIYGFTLRYVIEWQVDGGGWADIPDTPVWQNRFGTQIAREFRIVGKTLSGYGVSHRLTLPASYTTIDVRIQKRSGNSSSKISSDLAWTSLVEITEQQLNYAHRAVVGMSLDAKSFSNIPLRAYHVRGIKMRMPSNRDNDPDSGSYRAYSGIWDGTFTTAWSDNPAWILHEFLTNSRWGAGSLIDDRNVDKWSLYEIGRHCDEAVDDGLGGTEPRFTMNAYFQTQQEVFDAVTQIAATFRGMSFWYTGFVSFSQDKVKSVVHNFNKSNVIDGKFQYAGSARRARHTIVEVRYQDKDNFDKPLTEYVEDTVSLARFGPRVKKIAAFGVSSRGQARRVGLADLITERLETDTVTFRTGLEGALLRPGDIFAVQDPQKNAARQGGRIKASPSSTTVTLDREVTLLPATAYSLTLELPGTSETVSAVDNAASLTITDVPRDLSPTQIRVVADFDDDGTIDPSEITPDNDGNTRSVRVIQYDSPDQLRIEPLPGIGNTIDYRVDYAIELETETVSTSASTTADLTVSSAFTKLARPGSIWMLTEPSLTSIPYRCVGISVAGTSVYNVVGLEYQEAKFAAVEDGLVIDVGDPAFGVTPLTVGPPTGLFVTPETIITEVGSTVINLFVAWERNPDENITGYEVQWRVNDDNWTTMPRTIHPDVTIPNALPGTYNIRIRTFGFTGNPSVPADLLYILAPSGAAVESAIITGLELDGLRGTRTEWAGRDVPLRWRVNTSRAAELEDEPSEFGDGIFDPDIPAGPDPWFKGYIVEIWDPNTARLIRTEKDIPATNYIYTFDKNEEDAQRVGLTARRELEIKVYVEDLLGRVSPPGRILITNSPPLALTGVTLLGRGEFIWLSYDEPRDLDVKGVIVWMDTTSSITLDSTTEVVRSSDPFIVIQAQPGTTYFLRAAGYDEFTADPTLLNLTEELTVTTGQVGIDVPASWPTDDSDFFVPWGNVADVQIRRAQILDGEITRAQIANATITNAEIANATIGEVQIGTAAITNAKIQDLAVDTFKVQGASIFVTRAFSFLFQGTGGPGGVWMTAFSVPVERVDAFGSLIYFLTIYGTEFNPSRQAGMLFRCIRHRRESQFEFRDPEDFTTIISQRNLGQNGFQSFPVIIDGAIDLGLTAGTWTYDFQFFLGDGSSNSQHQLDVRRAIFMDARR